jgi:hypothetical protein
MRNLVLGRGKPPKIYKRWHKCRFALTVTAQRFVAELCENGGAKRHLPYPFSAHPPEGLQEYPFILKRHFRIFNLAGNKK